MSKDTNTKGWIEVSSDSETPDDGKANSDLFLGEYLKGLTGEVSSLWDAIQKLNERVSSNVFSRGDIVNDILVRIASAASGIPFDQSETE